MGDWWRELDRILRGEATRSSAIRRGTIEVRPGPLTVLLIGLAMVAGACMGSYALFRDHDQPLRQMVATTLKVPALFLLTLAVTFPSLYVSNALVGSRLTIESLARLLAAAMAVTVAILASLGPIVAFFSASTTDYAFMLLLNVAVFAASGMGGLAFLMQTLQRLSRAPRAGADPGPVGEVIAVDPAEVREVGVLEAEVDEPPSRNVRLVFRLWMILFGLVGAQMVWVLRPFLGAPGVAFSWFRPRSSNFFEAVWHAIQSFFS